MILKRAPDRLTCGRGLATFIRFNFGEVMKDICFAAHPNEDDVHCQEPFYPNARTEEGESVHVHKGNKYEDQDGILVTVEICNWE